MKPQDDYRNGDGGAGSAGSAASRSDDSEGEEASALEEELSLEDPAAPARLLLALNALRKARQHFDVLLAVDGEELPAHRAVLAGASPRLLAALGSAPRALRLPGLDADAVKELLEFAYTGRLRVRDGGAARRLYVAAARLRLEAARAHLAARLVARAGAADCLALRALPALAAAHRAALDALVAQHLPQLAAAGALAALPVVHMEMLQPAPAPAADAPRAVADAALAWLRDCLAADLDMEELCSRTHLVFVDESGALRDCGRRPAARGDAPELAEYRREAQERERARRPRAAPPAPPQPPPDRALHDEGDDECAVVCAREEAGGAGGAGGAVEAVLALRGRLVAARVLRRAGALGAGARGALPPPPADEEAGERIAAMSVGRCAAGGAALGERLLVCGGYDRARVLRCAEAYCPRGNRWAPLPDMGRARARFPAVRLGSALYVLGGSDGLAELDSVDVFEEGAGGAGGGAGGAGGGAWRARARLPSARSYAAAAADEARGALFVLGGWAGGRSLRLAHRYCPKTDTWTDVPPLTIGRSQSAGVVWEDALWALGGTDGWACLASTELLPLGGAGAGAWREGPPLPSPRRSVAGCVWRAQLVAAGGSGGAASLRAAHALAPGAPAWRPLPPLRRPRAAPSLAALHAVLYAAGGFSGKEFLSCVECLADPDGQWTSLWEPRGPPVAPAALAEASEASAEPPSALAAAAPAELSTEKNGASE